MRTQAIVAALFSALAGQVFGQDDSHDAPRVNDNPIGVKYKATLPKEPFFKDAAMDGNVKGFIQAEAPSDGHGVQFKVQFSNLPKEGGPFTYHIHVEPVPENGNCTATLAHLDPFARGEEPPCDPEKPASCQVGDNSGKHGKITSDPFTADYIDYYASTKEGIGAYFGNRSFVLHYANKTRLTCANFVNLNPGVIDSNYTAPAYLPTPTETVNPETNTPTPSSTGTSTGTGTGTGGKPISTESSVVSPNGASSATLPINLALAGVFALILAM